MTRRALFAVLLLGAAACGGRGGRASTAPTPEVQETATTAQVDTLWRQAQHQVRRGKWADAQKNLDRVLLEILRNSFTLQVPSSSLCWDCSCSSR